MNPMYFERRRDILLRLTAALDVNDEDGYCDAYDKLRQVEKEAGEFDGEDCDCALEICPACGGAEGADCTTCHGQQVVEANARTVLTDLEEDR